MKTPQILFLLIATLSLFLLATVAFAAEATDGEPEWQYGYGWDSYSVTIQGRSDTAILVGPIVPNGMHLTRGSHTYEDFLSQLRLIVDALHDQQVNAAAQVPIKSKKKRK